VPIPFAVHRPRAETKKLREENSKLKYQLEHLRAAAANGGVAGAASLPAGDHGHPAPAAPTVDVESILAEENSGNHAVDLSALLTRMFTAAVGAAFPSVDTDVAVVPNTAAGAGKKGKAGKGKKGGDATAEEADEGHAMYQCADALKLFGKLKKVNVCPRHCRTHTHTHTHTRTHTHTHTHTHTYLPLLGRCCCQKPR
jgi:hypothetical protein